MIYATVSAPQTYYATILSPLAIFASVSAPIIPVAPSGQGVDGQLYDEVTGALLYDATTGAPLVW